METTILCRGYIGSIQCLIAVDELLRVWETAQAIISLVSLVRGDFEASPGPHMRPLREP